MSYSHKYTDGRLYRQPQQTTDARGMSSEYETDSAYTYETIKQKCGNHNISQPRSKHSKDSKPHYSHNEIEPHRSHNTKCPVYVHHMKMQKNYSQNDAYRNSRQYRHQADCYNCNKWDYYDDRTHYMKNKFDKLTLSKDYDEKHTKSECTRKPCPVHHSENITSKCSKKRPSPTKVQTEPVDEEVINKLEESYWAKWNPKCKAHNRKIHANEAKMIRTEDEYNKRKDFCESERNLPLRCPDCFKCIPDDKDVKCLHKRTATKESKSSDFVKSDFDDAESPLEDIVVKHESTTNGCDCPQSCPGKEEILAPEQSCQDEDVLKKPPTTNEKQEQNQLDNNLNKNNAPVSEVQSPVRHCGSQACHQGVATKQKTSDSKITSKCNNPHCPHSRTAQYKTAVSLEGQDVEKQLNITQYSKLTPKPNVNKGVNAEGPAIDATVVDKKASPSAADATELLTTPMKSFPNDPMVTGDSKMPSVAKPTETPSIPTGPEGAEIPIPLKHTDSFIINSIKRNSMEGQPHYKQPTTIKLSNTSRVKGHSYPLKPILKKEKPHTPRKTLHSPKKPATGNTKTIKIAPKKRF